ncbi:MAG TPA: DUF5130 family protein [Marmoricola sp.]|nr:DUF5130 family protein [Marmoricola sp.]
MAAGDGFTAEQRHDIDRAIRAAETVSRYEFSVFVGASEGEPHAFAHRLHAALAAPDRSVLVMVDPDAHSVEVVTGSAVRRDLPDEAARLAIATMQSTFAAGDLTGGIKRGVAMLADAARKPETLHVHQP